MKAPLRQFFSMSMLIDDDFEFIPICRLRLHEEKQLLLQQLRDGMRSVSRLEQQLRQLSASALSSTSSSSSLGSLSSSHASSKGSLSSLSFTDIYGLSTATPADPAMLDLHRRVDKILNNNSVVGGQQQQQESGLQSAEESLTTPDSDTSGAVVSASSTSAGHHSQPSLSPRSSLSSVSPPVSPQDAQQQQQQLQYQLAQASASAKPPSYEHAYYGSVERQRRIQQHLVEAKQIADQLAELHLNKGGASAAASAAPVPKLSTIAEATAQQQQLPSEACGLELEQILNQQYGIGGATAAAAVPPPPEVSLSPICEVSSGLEDSAVSPDGGADASVTTPGVSTSSLSASALEAASAAVSDESVAGDSGVYEAVSRTQQQQQQQQRQKQPGATSTPLETSAQVQIKLRYSMAESVLHVGIEKARNIGALFVPEGRKM